MRASLEFVKNVVADMFDAVGRDPDAVDYKLLDFIYFLGDEQECFDAASRVREVLATKYGVTWERCTGKRLWFGKYGTDNRADPDARWMGIAIGIQDRPEPEYAGRTSFHMGVG